MLLSPSSALQGVSWTLAAYTSAAKGPGTRSAVAPHQDQEGQGPAGAGERSTVLLSAPEVVPLRHVEANVTNSPAVLLLLLLPWGQDAEVEYRRVEYGRVSEGWNGRMS
ncbi:hypothetical protein CEP52_004697 [Fusarium oligoseptatum]|uniref:Uncharacterized protein n=2 Tax=Fusarium solani species complex TaxID=232080 RepID=A0A428U2B3_9HYPO|nr:hypothetical protein CEP51_008720 [Fusarium floridanum]RSM08443.1 hypothetical protein CEP52_004697 [Fusarium oligoseptatum]